MNMKTTADRATGGFFLLFGVLLYFVIIPKYVEVADGAWLMPSTVPNAIAVVLSICGALLMLKPTAHRVQNTREMMFAGLYFTLLAAGLLLMSYVGFVYAAPVLALAVMLLIGERRPFWLLLGVVGLPAGIWWLVAYVLERALP
jgi:putative tricarboxylic transport membrane protein